MNTPPMSVVRHQNLHVMLDTPPVVVPSEPDWRAIARELMEEVDRRGEEIVRLRALSESSDTASRAYHLLAADRQGLG